VSFIQFPPSLGRSAGTSSSLQQCATIAGEKYSRGINSMTTRSHACPAQRRPVRALQQDVMVNEALTSRKDVRLVYVLRQLRHAACGGEAASVELQSGIESRFRSRSVRRIVLRGGSR